MSKMHPINILIKDVSDICVSYLNKEEQLYISKEWDKFDKNEVCRIAIKNEWLDLLEWVIQNVIESNKEKGKICDLAILYGKLDVLKWAIFKELNQFNNWKGRINAIAAITGQLDILKLLFELHSERDSKICSFAAIAGNLEILKWIAQDHNNSQILYDKNVCSYSRKAIKNEIRWKSYDSLQEEWNILIEKNGECRYLEILNWMKENKYCRCDDVYH